MKKSQCFFSFIEKLSHLSSHFLFPAFCHGCMQFLHRKEKIFCTRCLQLLIRTNSIEKTSCCFLDPIFCSCREDSPPLYACFAYKGTARKIIEKYTSGAFFLKKSIAAYLVLEFLKLDIDLPDIVLHVPSSWQTTALRGFSLAGSIAKEVAFLLEKKHLDILKKRNDVPPQRSLSIPLRTELSKEAFYCTNPSLLSGKSALIIDDLIVTRKSMQKILQLVEQLGVESCTGIAFCHKDP